eukprot:m.70226 g.70226  ORF g.70226 m.70226 type:complete len:1213 (+) comp12252_c0_seq3:40-3678(+)
MFITEIVVDGFKSYAQRTVIGGFDPLFNAITGLNGSGKSNILDSICFVLGITNLSQVRAGSLQELIYKQGQAGVTKATVTITFNNEDKAQSPIGYEQYDTITIARQIAIGGKNKYMINGHTAQQSRVANFFQSVQLNVNNPHFLIMQGRITKVLNMKPVEILSMIEEAAGTRMFETKKATALKTMAKKHKKLEEIDTVMETEITPTLERLAKERSSYLEFQKTKTEIEHFSRFLVAYKFFQAEVARAKLASELEEVEAAIEESVGTVRKMEMERDNTAQNIQLQEKRRAAELTEALKDMEKQVGILSKIVVQAKAELDNKEEAISEEKKAREQHAGTMKETQAAIAEKESEIAKAAKKLEKLQEKLQQAENAMEEAERRINAVSMGMSEVDGEAKTFAEQITLYQTQISTAASQLAQAEMTVEHTTLALKKKRPEAKKSEAEYKRHEMEVQAFQDELKRINEKLDKMEFTEGAESALRERKLTLEQQHRVLSEEVDGLSAKLAALDFTYSDPVPRFDRSKVNGLVASLITVKDVDTSTALEITAGGKLFQVVVADEVTGKQLLSKGKLKRRVTIIPLNKIAARTLKRETVAEAQRLVGKDNVDVALSFVGYDDEVSSAMEYVFGRTLICRTMDMAKKVTFHDKIRARSVTYDGDVFDPSGTLTGGAKASSSGVLLKLQALQEKRATLAEVEAELGQVVRELKAATEVATSYQSLVNMRDMKVNELDVLRVKLDGNHHYKAVSEVKELEETLAGAKTAIKECKEKEKDAAAKIKQLEHEQATYEQKREGKMKEAEKIRTKAKESLTKAKQACKQGEAAVQEVTLEKESLESELASMQTQAEAFESNIQSLNEERAELMEQLERKRRDFQGADDQLTDKKQKVTSIEDKISDLRATLAEAVSVLEETTMELKKLKHSQKQLVRDKDEAATVLSKLLKSHEWITSEKQYFGQPGTAFEFREGDPQHDPKLCQQRLDQLAAAQRKLEGNVNMKALAMFDKAEKEYAELLKKKQIVEADRAKIEKAIQELDEKKNQALRKAHKQVNRDFGSIFSTLLPGTQAKLVPVEGKDILDGLEVKIGFGSVWKESLQELSGGQRSLVALSLILSLLLFKPAPLYILDEVDAALDLSHTQNIGQMLRTHFNQSQFVVVSLKDGMFNNANVLFKTKFVDGLSTVRRYAQASSSAGSENPAADGAAAPAPKGRAGRAKGKKPSIRN